MKKFFHGMIVVTIALLALSCRDNGVGPDWRFPAINGKVVNAGGAPLGDVGVHYIMHFDSTLVQYTLSKRLPITLIRFELQEPSYVTLKLLRFGSRDTLLTILNNELFAAGVNEVEVNMSKLTNGMYIAHFIINGSVRERLLVLFNMEINQLIQTSPLATSDASGNFSLPISLLGIGTRILSMNANFGIDTLWISKKIDLVLFKEGYQPLVTPMSVDVNNSVKMTFQLRQ